MKRLTALLLVLAMTLSMAPASLAAKLTGTVTGDDVRIHSKPDIDSECYDQAEKGEVLTVKSVDDNGWAKVLFTYCETGEEMTGYISADYLSIKSKKETEAEKKAAAEKKAKKKAEAEKKAKKKAEAEKKAKKKAEAEKKAAAEESTQAQESAQAADESAQVKRAPSMLADSSVEVDEYTSKRQAAAQEETKRAHEASEASEASVDPADSAEGSGSAQAAAAEVSADPADASAPAAAQDQAAGESSQASDAAAASAQAASDVASDAAAAAEEKQQAVPEEEDEDEVEISPKVSYTATVNDENINLRKEPSLEAEILTRVPEGDIVIIRSEEDEEGWLKVLYYDSDGEKFKGYMLGEYLDMNSIGMGRSSVPSVIVRESPDQAADITGVVPKGKKVDVYVSRDGWYRIEYRDLSGWVPAECITVEGESDCEGYCRVTEDDLALREEPTKKSGKLEKIPEGVILQVTHKTENDKWYAVNYNGHSGYVNSSYVEDLEQVTEGYVQTTTSSLSLRTGPGSSYARLTTIPNGKVLPVSGTVGDWYEVKYGKFTGYVSGSFVSATTKKGFRAYPDYLEITTDNVAIREEPSKDADEIESVDEGTLLAIQGIRDGWYLVTYNGETGYVKADYAERGTEATEQAAEQAAAAIKAGGEAVTQSSGGGSSILSFAAQFVGNPYVWGGTSLTGGADCSGFVKSVLAHFGIDVPHSSASIRGCGRSVSVSDMQPGDIVCYSGHVGIYAGDGRLLSALGKKYGITYNSVHYKNILSVRRFS